MFGFFNRKTPAVRRATSLAEAEQVLARAQATGQKVIVDLSDIDIEELSQFVEVPAAKRKLGRNDLCPCGSGEKYKRCCLRH